MGKKKPEQFFRQISTNWTLGIYIYIYVCMYVCIYYMRIHIYFKAIIRLQRMNLLAVPLSISRYTIYLYTYWVTVKIGINGLSPDLYRNKHRINPE